MRAVGVHGFSARRPLYVAVSLIAISEARINGREESFSVFLRLGYILLPFVGASSRHASL
jgi:hypothetical protein